MRAALWTALVPQVTQPCPTCCPTPTHTLELCLVNTRLLFHCELHRETNREEGPRTQG